jgi:hypothetical protein
MIAAERGIKIRMPQRRGQVGRRTNMQGWEPGQLRLSTVRSQATQDELQGPQDFEGQEQPCCLKCGPTTRPGELARNRTSGPSLRVI